MVSPTSNYSAGSQAPGNRLTAAALLKRPLSWETVASMVRETDWSKSCPSLLVEGISSMVMAWDRRRTHPHVCVYLSIYTYGERDVPTYIHTYIHTYIQTDIHMYLYIHTYSIHIRICTCLVHIYIHIYMHIYSDIYIYIYVYVYVYMYSVCMHTYIEYLSLYIHVYA